MANQEGVFDANFTTEVSKFDPKVEPIELKPKNEDLKGL